MSVNYKAELTGVFGYPVAENPTGVMQEAAFAEMGLNWRYLTVEVKPEALPDAIRGVVAFGMQGVNLTIPHKVAVLPLLDEVSPGAALIGAVNTVRREGERLIGDNTDGKGFLRGLREEAGMDPGGKRAVILGAGGAARAITVELALAGIQELILLNRDPVRGEELAAHLRARLGTKAGYQPWASTYRVPPQAEILVNATSIGLYPETDSSPDITFESASPGLLVCDVVPNPPETQLIQTARGMGFPTLSGLAMLVYQGAIGFEMWTGQKAPEAAMKAALRKAFGYE